MEFNEKHCVTILERIYGSHHKYELIDLVSRRDERRVPIHRGILMASSKYFADLFRPNDAGEMPAGFIIDSNGDVIKTVVDFCYSGHIDLTDQNAENCLKIATDGEIDLLLNECRDYYAAKLSIETVVDVLLTAKRYNLDDLQRRASELLCSDLEHVPVTQTLQLNPEMMFHLMSNVDEAVSSDLLAERLFTWFQFAEAERGEYMPKMLRLIRLEQLTAKFLCETIEPLFEQFKCTALLYMEFKRRAMDSTPLSVCLSEKVDYAAASEKIAVVWVGQSSDYDCDKMCSVRSFIVEIFDGSLNKLTPQFASPRIDAGYRLITLYKDKIFARATGRPIIICDLKTGKIENLKSRMNQRRHNHAPIMMGKSLYIFGGSNGFSTVSSCERYDTEKGTWRNIKSMNHGRSHASTAILNGLIYVVGGYDRPSVLSTFVESYDPSNDQWKERAKLDVGAIQLLLVAFNGLLYAFLDGHGVREYDPVENIWTKIQTDYVFQSVVSANDRLFALTYDNRFGTVTVNKKKIDFAEHTKFDMSDRFGLPSLYQFEE